jgi:hypothetical protein
MLRGILLPSVIGINKKRMAEYGKYKSIQELLEASKVLIIIVVTSFKVWLRIYRSYGDSLKNQKVKDGIYIALVTN